MILDPHKLTEGMWLVFLRNRKYVVVAACDMHTVTGTPMAMFQYRDEAYTAALTCNRHTENFHKGVFKRLEMEKEQARRDLDGLCLEALK